MNSKALENKKTAVILLADDSLSDRTIVHRSLMEGKVACTFKEVEDGEQLLQYLLHEPPFEDSTLYPYPDLLLLDINMPRCDGKAALKRIRENPKTRKLPVIMLTTSDRDEDVIETYNLGVNAYIKKPVEREAFVNVVMQLEQFWFELVTLPSGN